MASVLATISEMFIMGGASLKVIFDLVTAYLFEHNFQVGKGDKKHSQRQSNTLGAELLRKVHTG